MLYFLLKHDESLTCKLQDCQAWVDQGLAPGLLAPVKLILECSQRWHFWGKVQNSDKDAVYLDRISIFRGSERRRWCGLNRLPYFYASYVCLLPVVRRLRHKS